MNTTNATYPNSKKITSILFNDLTYLSDIGKTITCITESDFDKNTGKPLKNNNVDNNINIEFFESIDRSLPESVDINDHFVYEYENLFNSNSFRDIHVIKETSIDIIFINEGASMKNMFGYYFYTINNDGTKQLLDNQFNEINEISYNCDDDNIEYYYRPTVIYPHIFSDPNISNSLQKRELRRLKGNLPNGNFDNIYVGFFLIPHGWYAHENNDGVDDSKTLYSTIEFNNDNKIHSIFSRSESNLGEKILLVGFEDTINENTTSMNISDLDYNDCIVGLIIKDIEQTIRDYNNFEILNIVPKVDITNNTAKNKPNIIKSINDSEYLILNSDYDIEYNKDYYFERHMIFSNELDRNTLLNLCKNININYKNGIYGSDNGSLYKIVIRYIFRKNDIEQSYNNNEKLKICLIDELFHKLPKEKENLTLYNNMYKLLSEKCSYTEIYKLYDQNKKYVIKLSDKIYKLYDNVILNDVLNIESISDIESTSNAENIHENTNNKNALIEMIVDHDICFTDTVNQTLIIESEYMHTIEPYQSSHKYNIDNNNVLLNIVMDLQNSSSCNKIKLKIGCKYTK